MEQHHFFDFFTFVQEFQLFFRLEIFGIHNFVLNSLQFGNLLHCKFTLNFNKLLRILINFEKLDILSLMLPKLWEFECFLFFFVFSGEKIYFKSFYIMEILFLSKLLSVKVWLSFLTTSTLYSLPLYIASSS